jgi:hypothetical protein
MNKCRIAQLLITSLTAVGQILTFLFFCERKENRGEHLMLFSSPVNMDLFAYGSFVVNMIIFAISIPLWITLLIRSRKFVDALEKAMKDSFIKGEGEPDIQLLRRMQSNVESFGGFGFVFQALRLFSECVFISASILCSILLFLHAIHFQSFLSNTAVGLLILTLLNLVNSVVWLYVIPRMKRLYLRKQMQEEFNNLRHLAEAAAKKSSKLLSERTTRINYEGQALPFDKL